MKHLTPINRKAARIAAAANPAPAGDVVALLADREGGAASAWPPTFDMPTPVRGVRATS